MLLPLLGEVAERSKAAVLKTVDPQGSGGSNPSLSANFSREASMFYDYVVEYQVTMGTMECQPR